MTQIVPVAPGFSEVVASGPQFGVKYVLTGMQGDASRITFNDPQDADHVGYLSNITGLDSPDVRESADDLIGDDGGVHGNFFYGRRPVVLEGMIDNKPGVTDFKFVTQMVPGDWIPTDVAGTSIWVAGDKIPAFTAYATDVLADAPAFFHRLGEPSGLSAADASPNGRTGTVSGATPTFGAAGALNGDSDTALSGQFRVINPYTWANFVGSGVTLEGWFNPTNHTAEQGLFGDPDLGGAGAYLYCPAGSTDVKWTTNRGVAADVTWTAALPAAAYAHVVLTFNDSTNAAELWINGVSKGVLTQAGAYNAAPGRIDIGDRSGGGQWVGSIDEVAVYPSILSQARIQSHYANGRKTLSQWTDQTANARHFAQATGTLQPTVAASAVNGLPAVRFDATDDRMSATIPADSSVTIFIVAKLTGSTGNTYDLLTFNSNFSTARLGNTGGNWTWSQNQAAGNVTVGGPNTNWGVIALRFNSLSSADAYFNGGAAVSFDPNDTFATQTSLVLGSTSWPVNSDVAEVIVYDSALSNTDLDTVRNFLGAKYAIGFGSAPAQVTRPTQVQIPLDANVVRNKRMTALQRVTNAMRKDMQMRWQPEGGVEQMLNLRRQQPLRITGAFNKTFQAGLVAADPRIYASAIQEVRMNVGVVTTVRNNGSIRTPPTATIFGPTSLTMTGIELHNHSTGEFFVFAPAYALAPGQYIVIDFVNKTVTRESGLNIYDQVTFASTVWWQLEPSDNLIELHGTGTTTAANCVLRWQDAWV